MEEPPAAGRPHEPRPGDPGRLPSTPPLPSNPNRTRDHLANERTFLAWIRTAMALIGLGFVLARMGLFLRQLAAAGVALGQGSREATGREFFTTGIVFLILGTLLAGFSARLYHRGRRAIEAQNFEPAHTEINALAGVVVLGGVVVVGLVLWHLVRLGF